MLRVALGAWLLICAGCAEPPDRVTAWRIRADAAADLDAEDGWAAPVNTAATVDADAVFRLRVEIGHRGSGPMPLRLEARRGSGAWQQLEALDHPYPDGIASAVTSIVSTAGYAHGEATTDLLPSDGERHVGGSGISLRDEPRPGAIPAGSTEWEWPLVIRLFSDSAVHLTDGETFEYRVTDDRGLPLEGEPIRVTLRVPPFHLGGTFVETPGRIGPFESSNGDLYFIQEPAETFNVFMVVKSSDGGRTWAEIDGARRPANGDLEAVSAVLVNDALHIVHQSDATWYHRFNVSGHPSAADRWAVTDELIGTEEDPPTQSAALALRSDDRVVAVYGGTQALRYRIREPDGTWSAERRVDADRPDTLAGPMIAAGSGGETHLAYVDGRGRAWLRRITADGSLTPRVLLASDLRTDLDRNRGAVLPLAWLPETQSLAVLVRRPDGLLIERRGRDERQLSAPVRVPGAPVASGPVDSDQATADVVAVQGQVHLLYVHAESGELFHQMRPGRGEWGTPQRVLADINGQWIRGMPVARGAGAPALAFVVDAGSDGGSGFNRFGLVSLMNTRGP